MGFLRKIASAFVVLDEASKADAPSAQAHAPGLDDITKETTSLLAQLESAHVESAHVESPQGEGARGELAQSAVDGPASADAVSRSGPGVLSAHSAEDVFREAGIGDGPNSAARLLRLIAGLHMFPRAQQLAMVRAMDAADDSWAEGDVVDDARARQRALRAHLDRLAEERTARAQAVADEIARTQASGDAVLQEIDRRLAELQQRRHEEAQTTARALFALEQQQRAIEADEQRARQGIAQVVQALDGLLAFLEAPEPAPAPRERG